MACATSSNSPQPDPIRVTGGLFDPEQISQVLQDTDVAKEIQILDVRTPEEYRAGCLKDSKMIDFRAADFDQKIATLSKDANYLVYCRSGSRSAEAVSRMRDIGINNIIEMRGGIVAWQAAGLPVENNCQ